PGGRRPPRHARSQLRDRIRRRAAGAHRPRGRGGRGRARPGPDGTAANKGRSVHRRARRLARTRADPRRLGRPRPQQRRRPRPPPPPPPARPLPRRRDARDRRRQQPPHLLPHHDRRRAPSDPRPLFHAPVFVAVFVPLPVFIFFAFFAPPGSPRRPLPHHHPRRPARPPHR